MSHLRFAYRIRRNFLSATPLSQTKALYLASLCFWQGFDEQDATGVFEWCDDRFYMVLQELDHLRITNPLWCQHHMRLDDLASVSISHPHYGAFQHSGVRQKRSLDFWPRDIVSGGNDHIVRAGGEMKAALVILPKAIARQIPAILHIFTLAIICQIAASRRPAHGKTTNFAPGRFAPVLTNDPRFISGDRSACAGGAMVVEPVG